MQGPSSYQVVAQVIVGGSGTVGVFVYAPNTTPAFGNQPIASISNSTTDPYGNPIQETIAAYGPPLSSGGVVAGPITGYQVVASGNLTYTFSVKPPAGSKVLFATVTSNTVTSVTDNGSPSQSFTQEATYADTAGHAVTIWRADNVQPTGSTYTITAAISGAVSTGGCGRAYLGVNPGGPTAVSVNANLTSNTPTTNSVTPVAAGALYFGGMQTDSSLNPETISGPNNGFTNLGTQTNGASFQAAAIADKFDPAGPTSTNVGWSLGDTVPWSAGLVVYDHAPLTTPPSIVTSVVNNTLNESFNTGLLSDTPPGGHIFVKAFQISAPGEQLELTMIGPTSILAPGRVDIQLLSSNSVSPGSATGFLVYSDTAGGFHQIAFWGQHGFNGALTQAIVGVQPGTIDTTLAAETWHNMALGASFAAGSPAPQYRFEPIGAAGQVRLRGVVTTAGAVAGGSTIATLPAGYHPANLQQLVSPLAGYTYAAGQASINISTGGVITNAVAAAGVSELIFDGVTFPLD